MFSKDACASLHYPYNAGGHFDENYLELETLQLLQQLAEMTSFDRGREWVKQELKRLWRARAKGDFVEGRRMRVGATRAEKNRSLREDVQTLIGRLEVGEK